MLHRGIKFVHAAALAFSAMLAFLVVSDLDERMILGNRAVLVVNESSGSASGEEVVRTLTEFVAARGAVIGRELPDLEDSEGRRHLYLAVGDPQSTAASWLKGDGYPRFARQVITEVHPMAELGNRDPRGTYYLFGLRPADQEVVAKFASLGLKTTVSHPLSFFELRTTYADSMLAGAFLVVALALVTLTGASVLLSAKAYGVLRLHGASCRGAFIRDLRQLRRFWLSAAGVLTALVLTSLGIFNGWASLGLYAAVAAAVAGMLELFVLATHAAVLRFTFRAPLPAALNGEVPALPASLTAYAVRIPALLLTVALLASVAAASEDLLERRQAWETYAQVGDATGIRITGSVGIDEIPDMEQAVGRRLHQADKEGQIIMAGRLWLRALFRKEIPGELLVVNEAFLAEQPVLGPNGRRYLPEARQGKGACAGAARLLVPEHLATHLPLFRQGAPGILSPENPGRITSSDIETRPMKDGQQIFAYTPGEDTNRDGSSADRSFVRDPVLLVIPNGSDHLTEVNYLAFATYNQLFFPDPQDVRDIMREDDRMRTYIAALLPVKQKAALAMREATYSFRLQLLELAAGLAVLLVTAVGVCIIHARKNAQTIFARHLSGWPFAATHRALLSAEAGVAVLILVWLPARTWWTNQELTRNTARKAPSPWPSAEFTGLDMAAAVALAGVTLGVVLLVLNRFHRRIVARGSSKA
ncbi:hypothetical protein OG863_01045 [Streptomyces decoyicus]|uniref:Uncharacterized protein n=1 Tax=Streptomyces decoyicus TaxID=249567 RepID=A0ABZ1F8M8_9ACTN|nr:hypothetical protein [Streptomyces decoyicus]WSB66672.1 hypothetical protein OG863_01045 [Streptomyces decoyicus]